MVRPKLDGLAQARRSGSSQKVGPKQKGLPQNKMPDPTSLAPGRPSKEPSEGPKVHYSPVLNPIGCRLYDLTLRPFCTAAVHLPLFLITRIASSRKPPSVGPLTACTSLTFP